MIKIHDLKGYKFIGDDPLNKHLIFRDNLTYLAFSMTNYREDIKKFEFLIKYHVKVLGDIADIEEMLNTFIIDNKIKMAYLIIRQGRETNGDVSIALTNKKPPMRKLNRIIKEKKEIYNL